MRGGKFNPPNPLQRLMVSTVLAFPEFFDSPVTQGIGFRITKAQSAPAREQWPFDVVGERINLAFRQDEFDSLWR